MPSIRIVCTVLLICAPFQPAFGKTFRTGNDLYEDCTKHGSVGEIFCLGYVAGVVDQLEIRRGPKFPDGCIPRTVTKGQMKDVVLQYLQSNPETRDITASLLVSLAVAKAWPC